ncbi:MAG TPA: tRNA (adenosine(37)-N6)-threonylcarbamoyltransferase complex ATPase subunit type 1 TsaE [Candidatus Limnocylindria bacterium]|nr:tRNA (adenosine(37)-N6)-threonylcarbamoyltransferase complex ATPase subunit type 1 TsaE [Candidatus Limnocylindria bacterium]
MSTASDAMELDSWSPEATRRLAGRMSAAAAAGDVVCLWGELGAGKTVFAKGFGLGLGIEDTISSPTFVLMGEYAGRLPLFHIDLYRLASAAEALDGGLIDDRQGTGVVLIEWPDRLGDALPADRLDVHIDGGPDEQRRLRIAAVGTGYERYVHAAAASDDGVAGAAPGGAA